MAPGSPVYDAILDLFKDDKATTQEILDVMIASAQSNKDYNFAKQDDLEKAIDLRLDVIHAASVLNLKIKNKTMLFTGGENVLLKLNPNLGTTDSVTPKAVPAKDNKGNTITVWGEQVKAGKTPSDALDELTVVDTKEILKSDCASAIALLMQMGLRTYYGKTAYNGLFDGKEKPWYIAGFYTDFTSPCTTRFWDDFDTNAAIAKAGAVKMDLIPGDVRGFYNPDFTDKNYQSENTIYLGNNTYFAFPWGSVSLDDMITHLSNASTNPKSIRDLGGSRVIKPGP